MRRMFLSALAGIFFLLAVSARASVITYDITFTASGTYNSGYSSGDVTLPFTSAGSYKLTIDSSQSYVDLTTTGLEVDLYGAPLTPSDLQTAFFLRDDDLTVYIVGYGGPDGYAYQPFSGGKEYAYFYALEVSLPYSVYPGHFVFSDSVYYPAGANNGIYFQENNGTAGVIVDAAATPELSSFILVGTGLLVGTAFSRKQFAVSRCTLPLPLRASFPRE